MVARDNLTDEQKQLEKPVKGYQFKELTDAFQELKKDTTSRLDTLIEGQKGVVTHNQLDIILKELSENIKKDIDLKYEPTKKTVDTWGKRLWAIAFAAITAIMSSALIAIKIFGE